MLRSEFNDLDKAQSETLETITFGIFLFLSETLFADVGPILQLASDFSKLTRLFNDLDDSLF